MYVGLSRTYSRLTVPQNTDLSILNLPFTRVLHKEEQGISMYEIGKPTPGQPVIEKVLMLVGATGAGKTTLINGMVNYVQGVQWDDNYRVQLISYENAKSQSSITTYTIHPSPKSRFPHTLTIVDTPSFNDAKHDQLFQQIQEFFSTTLQGKKGIDHIDGIGFVIQSSLARLTIENRMLTSIMSIFGSDVVDNIFMMITFADASKPPVMTAIKEANVKFNKIFKFNNSAIYASNSSESGSQEYDFNSMFWKLGMNSFKYFFEDFCHAEQVSLYLTKEVLRERKHLEVAHQAIQQQIDLDIAKLEELKREEEILHQKEADLAANKDFTYQVTVPRKRVKDLPSGMYSINCTKCEFTCGDKCGSKEKDIYNNSSMDGGGRKAAHCRICPQKCFWKDHKRSTYCWEVYNVEETRTSQELQKKFMTDLEGKSRAEYRVHQVRDLLEKAEKDLILKIESILDIMEQLNEKALKASPITQTEYVDSLIEKEKGLKKQGYQQRIQIFENIKQEEKLKRRPSVMKQIQN